MPTKDQLTQFDYLLNAMEAAAQHENPADHGYAQKRQALYAYVRGLENRPLATPDTLPPVEVGDWIYAYGDVRRVLFPWCAEVEDGELKQWGIPLADIEEVRGIRNGIAFRWQRGKE